MAKKSINVPSFFLFSWLAWVCLLLGRVSLFAEQALLVFVFLYSIPFHGFAISCVCMRGDRRGGSSLGESIQHRLCDPQPTHGDLRY